MKISEKIAQIRLEPEHIRLRWVWGAVAVSMFFILAIWIFSINSLFKEENTPNQEASKAVDITQQLQTLKAQAPSIKDLTDQSKSIGSEGIADTKDETNFQYPAVDRNTSSPQASAYSSLPTEASTQ